MKGKKRQVIRQQAPSVILSSFTFYSVNHSPHDSDGHKTEGERERESCQQELPSESACDSLVVTQSAFTFPVTEINSVCVCDRVNCLLPRLLCSAAAAAAVTVAVSEQQQNHEQQSCAHKKKTCTRHRDTKVMYKAASRMLSLSSHVSSFLAAKNVGKH